MACPHLEEMPITSLLVQSTAKKRKSDNKDGEKTKYIIKSESKHKNNTIDNNKFEIANKNKTQTKKKNKITRNIKLKLTLSITQKQDDLMKVNVTRCTCHLGNSSQPCLQPCLVRWP